VPNFLLNHVSLDLTLAYFWPHGKYVSEPSLTPAFFDPSRWVKKLKKIGIFVINIPDPWVADPTHHYSFTIFICFHKIDGMVLSSTFSVPRCEYQFHMEGNPIFLINIALGLKSLTLPVWTFSFQGRDQQLMQRNLLLPVHKIDGRNKWQIRQASITRRILFHRSPCLTTNSKTIMDKETKLFFFIICISFFFVLLLIGKFQ